MAKAVSTCVCGRNVTTNGSVRRSWTAERAIEVKFSLRVKAMRRQQAHPEDHDGEIKHVFACQWRALRTHAFGKRCHR